MSSNNNGNSNDGKKGTIHCLLFPLQWRFKQRKKMCEHIDTIAKEKKRSGNCEWHTKASNRYQSSWNLLDWKLKTTKFTKSIQSCTHNIQQKHTHMNPNNIGYKTHSHLSTSSLTATFRRSALFFIPIFIGYFPSSINAFVVCVCFFHFFFASLLMTIRSFVIRNKRF